MTNNPAPIRSLHQIIDKDGKPCRATATETIWAGYNNQQFANVTTGNTVTPYTTGKAYFADLRKAIASAKNEILIAGWQVNWDTLLEKGVRLFDALLDAAKANENLHIYVMPWNDTAPVQTFDEQTKSVMKLLNEVIGRKCAHTFLCASHADESPKFFSHHQKQVVIDRKTGFVGGIDLAYGRFDDASCDLHAHAEGREALNRYNGCIAQVGKIEASVVNADVLSYPDNQNLAYRDNRILEAKQKILAGAWQIPYKDDSPTHVGNLSPTNFTIDADRQPRMPWQDVHCRIEGPAVSDLARNFIWRWNGMGGVPALEAAKRPSQYPKPGNCQVQVLRSAPRKHREAEYNKLPYAFKKEISIPLEAENDIVRAMQTLILKAQHFIYIENQFFVSDFGQSQGANPDGDLSGPAQQANKVNWGLDQTSGAYLSTTWMAGDQTTAKKLPKNQICATIAQRIDTAIQDRNKHPFHVIITLPVHPEGCLNNGTIMTQVHWTMQALAFGSHSLLNRIRRSIKAQQLREKKDPNPKRVFDVGNNEYEDIPVEECFRYVTLLNLRNWAKLGERYVTEQIYVHSKLMIVDDRYALLGSANINDRSLLGSRDSELAVLVVDDEVERKDICGNGKALPVRGFAHQLRREVWRKIFGLSGKVRPAVELQSAVDHPGAPASWLAIQKVAQANAELYEGAFDYIPRNKDPNDEFLTRPASIWPVWNTAENDPQKAKKHLMPFEPDFWKTAQHNPSGVASLAKVKGFITALPIEWTRRENNNFGYHTALVARNEQHENSLPKMKKSGETYAQRSLHTTDDEKELNT